VGLEGNTDAGENAEPVEEGGIEREAQVGKGAKLGRVVGIADGEHSGGGSGGFGERGGLVQHGDTDAPVMELKGEREADDTGSSDADVWDADVWVVHGLSLVRLRRGYSFGVRVCRLLGCRCVAGRLYGNNSRDQESGMSDEGYVEQRSISGALLGAVAVALLAALGGLVWSYGLQNHLSAAEQKIAAADQKNAELTQQLEATNARLRATSETLGQSVGMTQKQIELRTKSIIAAQRAATSKLEEEQAAASKQIGAVSTDVASVKTDVGGVKTDVASTKSDLEATKTQLTRVMGDAGVMSGLIATNHDELEVLKHRGDRNYLEFTLQKGAKPTLLSTVKLQLKKADEKHSRYTLVVSSDDRNIEKKDKGLDEPVQFYNGKDPVLYELVVNVIEKNKVSGYLSTPKNTAKATGGQ
jgi:chromosome segregation ATPase